MSHDVDWDVEKYRDDHESEDHWQLRRAFLVKWKDDYPEERLICLARVFTNVELLGCRYPAEVMEEISKLSYEVAQPYRKMRKSKLKRTFVSASDAAEDRARGIKREGGIIVEEQPKAKIQFIAAGKSNDDVKPDNDDTVQSTAKFNDDTVPSTAKFNDDSNTENDINDVTQSNETAKAESNDKSKMTDKYMEELKKLDCMDVRGFKDFMFKTEFGRMVLLVRPWATKLWNIQTSCQVCNIDFQSTYEKKCLKLTVNGQMIAQATGESKVEARGIAENIAWEKLCQEVVSVLVKEQFIAQNDTRITVDDVAGRKCKGDEFGTPVENSVAMKMMQMMGWKGGGLGAESQGIAEPIKPNLQMVNRAGLGSTSSDIRQLRKAAYTLMERYIASDTLELDLVFSSEFSKDERAVLHQCAQRVGLASRSYGDKDRFLVVKKKVDPFSLARAVIDKGGTTPKYQVFIPAKLASRNVKR